MGKATNVDARLEEAISALPLPLKVEYGFVLPHSFGLEISTSRKRA
jgi:hypothetical protein